MPPSSKGDLAFRSFLCPTEVRQEFLIFRFLRLTLPDSAMVSSPQRRRTARRRMPSDIWNPCVMTCTRKVTATMTKPQPPSG